MSSLPPSDVSVINNAFKERGLSDVIKIDVVPIRDRTILKLVFEQTKSDWRQGVWMKTDSGVLVNQQRLPAVSIWQDTSPPEVKIECFTRNGRLYLYNIWERDNREDSQAWSSGMRVEQFQGGRRYRCNDIGFDTAFDKLVFRIEIA